MMFLAEINLPGRGMAWKARDAVELRSFAKHAGLLPDIIGPVTLDTLRSAARAKNRKLWAFASPFDLAAALQGGDVPETLIAPLTALLDRHQSLGGRAYQTQTLKP